MNTREVKTYVLSVFGNVPYHVQQELIWTGEVHGQILGEEQTVRAIHNVAMRYGY